MTASPDAVEAMLAYWRAQGCFHSVDTCSFVIQSIAGAIRENGDEITNMEVAEIAERLGLITIDRREGQAAAAGQGGERSEGDG